MREIIVGENDKNQRLDKFLCKLCPLMPLSMLYKSLRKDCVKLNDRHIKDPSVKLSKGDRLKLYFKDEFFEKSIKNDIFLSLDAHLDIIYEDENILLINKAVGMVVHADEQNKEPSLIDHIKAYLYQKGEYIPENENSFVPALANRLDRNTAGIVIAAKNAQALRIMNQKIKDRELKKLYLCIVLGTLRKKQDEMKAFLFKDEKQKRVYISKDSKKGSKTIITKYKVLAENNDLSLVEVELITGRTHQIRAHFSYIGNPLLGDGKYGNNKINKQYKFENQALCSYKLVFDFKTDAGDLEYLNHKEFKVENVDFLKYFK